MDVLQENLEWKSEYSIGNIDIDKEHQKLFYLAKQALSVNTLNNEAKERSKLKGIVKELFEYVGTHFANEQSFMRQIKFPELAHHITLHKNMVDLLNKLLKELNTLTLKEIENNLSCFIESYFVRHIVEEDKKIKMWNSSLSSLRENFRWHESYCIGDETIDKQHKELFDLAQSAFEAVEDNKRDEKIKGIVTRLYHYMKGHFKYEEEFMLQHKFPDYEQHKESHDDIIHIINTFVKRMPQTNGILFEKELAIMIDRVLVQHIIKEDDKIREYVEENVT
jgi:hemerythrin